MDETRNMQKAKTRIELIEFATTVALSLPAELQTKFNSLLPQLLNEKETEGKVGMIYEGRNSVYKAIVTQPPPALLIRFPTSTQLDADSKSSDAEVAEKAKRLQALEKMLEDAFYDSPPGRVIVHYTPKPGADAHTVLDADQINSISILV